jgi:hypothetical protein
MVGFTVITLSSKDIWEFPDDTAVIPHDELETDHPDREELVWAYELTEVL